MLKSTFLFFSSQRGRGMALRLPHPATARVRPYLLPRYQIRSQNY